MSTVLVTSRSFSSGEYDAVGRLETAGYNVVRGGHLHDLDELEEGLARAIGWIAGTGPITDAHIAAAPNLQAIARYGVGVESVDVAAASRRNIVVTNTPEANSESVADHTMALMLSLLRHIVPADRGARAGEWRTRPSRELGALTVGVVGFGAIGRRVVDRLLGFGTKVLVVDPFADPAKIAAAGAQSSTLEQLQAECDIVTLHAPGNDPILDRAWIEGARDELLIVNTGRPHLLDDAAAASALRAGTLGGVAADVFEGDDGSSPAPLAAADLSERVVLSPHISSHTRDAVDRTSRMACDELLAVLQGRTPNHPVHPRNVS